MRACKKDRAGFDRVLMAVAATFLTVSATSAMAQDPSHSTPAELAIDAAIPRPEPANVPPPTAADFKMDNTTASTPPAATAAVKPAEAAAPASVAAAPAPVTADHANLAPAVPLPAANDASAAEPAATATVTPAAPATTATVAPIAPAATAAVAPAAPAPAAASTPETAPAPAAEPAVKVSTVAAPDQPVADKIKDQLAARNLRLFDRKAERTAVEKYYGARDYAPIWTQAGTLTDAAKGAIARLKDAASDGLNASDYPVPDFAAAATSPDALAEADLKLTDSVLDYARQAQSGRMHWSQVSADISYPEHPTDPTQVLTNVTTAKDASTALDSYNPPQKLYQELKRKLAELRGQGDKPVVAIAEGPVLKYVAPRKKQAEVLMDDPRVPQLRAKLGVTDNADDTHYDAKVAAAVRRFQEGADLPATGNLDNRTVAAINAPKRDKQIDTVIVNMERWRWLPRDLGVAALNDAYVILNIPDYTLRVMQNGAPLWTTKVVTGKPGIHATPLLTETMKYITVNPTWNVPPSIVYGEYLPALQQDPTVLQRMGLKVEQSRDGSVHISQPPGAANALGRIRFNFPNKFLVYQHDTPDKYLFDKTERAYSHGCMRVQYPDQYASVLLNIELPNEHWTPERIRSMYGSNEVDLKFPNPIPVNITYQTAFVDDAGKLEFRKDVYGRDATMISMLKGPHNRDMENVVAHSQPSYSKPAGTVLPPNVSFASNNGSSGLSFFERLFGPPTPPAPVGRRAQQPQRRLFTR